MKLRSDLPIKYYLNLHNEERLTDDLSPLFDIIQYLIRVLQVKQKELELKNLKFTKNSLKYVFGERMKDETFKTDLVKRLKSLIEAGHMEVEGETIWITKKGLTNFYTEK